jgi:hypothetical protein
MGADAEVYVFDDRAYRAQVVPLFRNLLRYGLGHPALNEAMDRFRPGAGGILRYIRKELQGLEPTDLDTYCTYLGEDLRLLTPPAGLPEKLARHEDGWEDRACRREDCPVSAQCPFFIADHARRADPLSLLFQTVVSAVCLGESQFVGRSSTVFGYLPVLRENAVSWDGELGRLLAALGMRGAVVGYSFGITEGIHGWLSHEEAGRLADLLATIRLPLLEPSFEAMRRTRRPGQGYHLDGWEWEELSLGFVRTVAVIASRSGKGLLWGNDVAAGGLLTSSWA